MTLEGSDPPSSPEKEKTGQLAIRSATPSESSTSKPLPEIALETLSVPEWKNATNAVDWFVKLRKVVKSIIYNYCGSLQKALKIFEENDATHYTHYLALQDFLRVIWTKWLEYANTKIFTVSFLLSSILFKDLFDPLLWMQTPYKAAKMFAQQMGEIRHSTRLAAVELTINRSLVQDAATRLAELNDGHEVAPFRSLPTTETGNSPESDSENLAASEDTTESDEVDIDELIADRGEMRDDAVLESNGFDPIWMEGKYPGEVPDEIRDFLNDDPETSKPFLIYTFFVLLFVICLTNVARSQMIGSNRSIFWLLGYNDVVKTIDDPGCVLEDEIVDVPNGIHPATFLLRRYADEDKLTRPLFEKYMAGTVSFPANIHAMPTVVPSQVTDSPNQLPTPQLYPLCRIRSLPQTTLAVHVKAHKNKIATMNAVRKALGDTLNIDSGKFWFLGLSLRALELSMTFFVPVVASFNADNEFGPAIYAADDFEEALPYAMNGGAMMVFWPEFQGLAVWTPEEVEWRHLTATWLQFPIPGLKVSGHHSAADVIQGPVSMDQGEARKKGRFPSQGKSNQIACVSYSSCERLARSLVAIIYISR